MKGITKVVRNFSSQSSANLEKTALNRYHKEVIGGKMVEFAGYEMPVLYKDYGVLKEHMQCRNSSALFDVSHMGQLRIFGKDSVDFLETLLVGNIRGLSENNGSLTLILNDQAGIIDDSIISKSTDHYKMVVNGGNKKKDLVHINKLLSDKFQGKDVRIEYLEEQSLVALQGPLSHVALQRLIDLDLTKLTFGMHANAVVKQLNIPITIFRMGYTGEDGFEISVTNEDAEKFFDLLLTQPEVAPAGLGARDSLRLEAGLCLHGNDMSDQTTPAQCTLMWTVRKKEQGQNAFIGRAALTKQRKDGIPDKRVGFKLTQKGIIRPPCEIYNTEGQQIGYVTSGVFSPILQYGIGMCFVHPDYSQNGTEIIIKQKNKDFKAEVTKMPFVPTKYYRG